MHALPPLFATGTAADRRPTLFAPQADGEAKGADGPPRHVLFSTDQDPLVDGTADLLPTGTFRPEHHGGARTRAVHDPMPRGPAAPWIAQLVSEVGPDDPLVQVTPVVRRRHAQARRSRRRLRFRRR